MNKKLCNFFKSLGFVFFLFYIISGTELLAQVMTPELNKYIGMDAEELWNHREELVAKEGPLFQVLEKAKNTDNFRQRSIYLERYETIINRIKYLDLDGTVISVYDVPGFGDKLRALDEKEEEIRIKYTEAFNLAMIYSILIEFAPEENLNLDEKIIKTVSSIFKSANLSDPEIEILIGRPKLFYFIIDRANKAGEENKYKEDLLIAADLLRMMLFKKETYIRINELSEKYDIERLNQYNKSFVPEFEASITAVKMNPSKAKSLKANIVNKTLRALRIVK
jgi:hypothetical protein